MVFALRWQDYVIDDTDYLVSTFFVTLLLYYALLEFLERKCNMEPQIYIAHNIKALAHHIEHHFDAAQEQHSQHYVTSKLNSPMATSSGSASAVEMAVDMANHENNGGAKSIDMIYDQPDLHTATSHTTTRIVASINSSDGTNNNDDYVPKTQSMISKEKKKVGSMPARLTKTMDSQGKFRTTVRVSVQLLKTIWCFSLFIFYVSTCFIFPEWYYDILWKLDKSTLDLTPYRVGCCYMIAFYCWELNVNRYGRLSWSTIAHHVMASFVAYETVALKVFLPFALWYVFTGVSMQWCVMLAFTLRNLKWSHEHATFIRRWFKFVYYEYLIVGCGVNIGGQLVIYIRAIQTGNVLIAHLITMAIAICVWLYDDYKLLKILKEYSLQHYEIAALMQLERVTSVTKVPNIHVEDTKSGKTMDI